MFSQFAWFAGFRNFSQAKQSRLVSFISLLAILGLVFGVALLVVVLSIMNGFDREMQTRILGQVPHIQIYKPLGGIYDWPALKKRLEAAPGVLSAEPYTRLEGLLTGQGKAGAVELEGLDLAVNPRVRGLIPEPVDATGLYVATGVASQLNLKQGDRVVFLAPEAKATGKNTTGFNAHAFTIAGVFETRTNLDQYLTIASLETVSGIAGISGAVRGFQLQVEDIFDTRNLGFKLLRDLPPGYSFTDWLQSHGNLYQAIKMSRNLVSLLVFLIMGIAVFNVISLLVMTVVDKKSAIAIYKTLGATTGEVMAVFIVQGMMIGIIGTVLGLVAGVLITGNLDVLVGLIEQVIGRKLLDPAVYPVSFLPVQLRGMDLLLIALVSLALNLLATIYPAFKAARTRPAVVLSQE